MSSKVLDRKRILIVDDDTNLCYLIGAMLLREGAEVFAAYDGQDGLKRLSEYQPDLVILDLMMPGLDGWEVCRQIRQISDVPVIILSALGDEKEIVLGLNVGADDYITKPVSSPVLVARSQSALRRAAKPSVPQKMAGYEDHYLMVALESNQVAIRGNLVKLTDTEYKLLAYLVRHRDQIRTFSQILKYVWGNKPHSPEFLESYLWSLRQKLEPYPERPVYIITEQPIGCRFVSHHLS